jgi:hypothetical protein
LPLEDMVATASILEVVIKKIGPSVSRRFRILR